MFLLSEIIGDKYIETEEFFVENLEPSLVDNLDLLSFLKLDLRTDNLNDYYRSAVYEIGDFLKFVSQDIRFCYNKFVEQNDFEAAFRCLNGVYISTLDKLTGLETRKHLDHRLFSLEKRLSETGETFSVAIGDIDNFKQVNDVYGHSTGDEVLKRVKRIFEDSLRPLDSVYRWGGEEFAFIFPNTGILDAYYTVERVRKNIESRLKLGISSSSETPIIFDSSKISIIEDFKNFLPISCSFGVSEYSSDCVNSVVDLLALADEAMYISKNSGKNCVTKK